MKYKIIWKACFKDNIEINQFDDVDQTQEHLFKEVLERQDKLVLFCLFNIITGDEYKVDLLNGVVTIGKVTQLAIDHTNKFNNRLIYFRRILKELILSKTIEEEIKQITYFLGFQYTENERNIKKLIQIYDDGKVVVY